MGTPALFGSIKKTLIFFSLAALPLLRHTISMQDDLDRRHQQLHVAFERLRLRLDQATTDGEKRDVMNALRALTEEVNAALKESIERRRNKRNGPGNTPP